MSFAHVKVVSVHDEWFLCEFVCEQLRGVANVDGRLLLVTGKHPNLDAGHGKIGYRLRNAVLKKEEENNERIM
jgi:hypothetical protein